MKFTLVFPSSESVDLSVGLVFAPCAMWTIGEQTLLNPHQENPHYVRGDFQNLLTELEKKNLLNPELKNKNIYIIVHYIGHGTQAYLDDLILDISECGYIPIEIS